jgi:hypothetical protein
MHMSGLTRRTQLLLDDERYERLERRSAETGRSVASIIREAIDEKLMHDPDAERRRAAGRRLLAAPTPDEGREPDWEDVKRDLLDDRYGKGEP